MNVSVAPRLTRAAEGLPRRRFTVAEVEAMVEAGIIDEDERVELIGGELVPMSPKGSHHELVKSAVNFQWGRVCPETCRLIVIYSVEPGLLALSPQNVLLVVEIADTSLRYDRGRKAGLYALFGVRELWVIDAVKLTTRVFWTPHPDGYRERRDFGAAERMVPQFAPAEFALTLDELKLV